MHSEKATATLKHQISSPELKRVLGENPFARNVSIFS